MDLPRFLPWKHKAQTHREHIPTQHTARTDNSPQSTHNLSWAPDESFFSRHGLCSLKHAREQSSQFSRGPGVLQGFLPHGPWEEPPGSTFPSRSLLEVSNLGPHRVLTSVCMLCPLPSHQKCLHTTSLAPGSLTIRAHNLCQPLATQQVS